MEINEIFDQVVPYHCHLVEVTGGEPLVQQDAPVLIHSLLEDGYTVLLETNGTQDIGRVDDRCVKIVDVKCPSSGMMDKNDLQNLKRLTGRDELKFVIGDREDYDYARKIVGHADMMGNQVRAVNFSPVFGRLQPKVMAEWILEDHLQVRLHLQLHKYIWGPDARGV